MSVFKVKTAQWATTIAIFLIWQMAALATDWPMYRGPTTDGISPDPILTNWPTNGPPVIWQNGSLSNGFSVIVVSRGRAFTMISQFNGASYFEYCVSVDAATGTNIWATQVDSCPFDPTVTYNGGDGTPPYNTGDGPRDTPSVDNDRVIALTVLLHLVCMNVTNGAILWDDDLQTTYGASVIQYDSCESPTIDNGLIYINLNTANNNQTLAAFRTSDGSVAWSSQNEKVTHTTPVVITIQGVRQVIFATTTGLISVDSTSGAFLWKFPYPFPPISVSMGAGPVVYSNMVYCTAGYGSGAAAATVTLSNNVWTATQLYYKNTAAGQAYSSIWMTPVCYQGYIYSLCGQNSTFLTPPLSCIQMSTGNLMWSTNNFGMGGLILVNSNLLVLTEDGQLVLAQCNPNAYTELARYRAFTFTAGTPGKCWNNPSYANGIIYARSTRSGLALNVAAGITQPPPIIATQPLSRAAVVGSSPSFSVLVTNSISNNYQWEFAVTNVLAGRTNATLVLTNVQSTNFGNYTVLVSNSGGAVTSTPASLTLAASPAISSSTLNGKTLSFVVPTQFGPTYFVEYKTNLAQPAWTPLTNVAGTGSSVTITDRVTTNAITFYRVRLQ